MKIVSRFLLFTLLLSQAQAAVPEVREERCAKPKISWLQIIGAAVVVGCLGAIGFYLWPRSESQTVARLKAAGYELLTDEQVDALFKMNPEGFRAGWRRYNSNKRPPKDSFILTKEYDGIIHFYICQGDMESYFLPCSLVTQVVYPDGILPNIVCLSKDQEEVFLTKNPTLVCANTPPLPWYLQVRYNRRDRRFFLWDCNLNKEQPAPQGKNSAGIVIPDSLKPVLGLEPTT